MDRLEKKEAREKRLRDIVAHEKQLTAAYHTIRDSEALQDILTFARRMSEYHVRIAKDGVGYKDQVGPNGEKQQVLTTFDNNQKLDHLQRSAGIEEVLDYITRKLTIKPEIKKDKPDEQNSIEN